MWKLRFVYNFVLIFFHMWNYRKEWVAVDFIYIEKNKT